MKKRKTIRARGATASPVASAAESPRVHALTPHRALALPFAFTLGLMTLALVPSVRGNSRLLWSFLGAAGVLLAWIVLFLVRSRQSGRTFKLEVVLRKQHYLQACAQGSVLLYWGWYWREVYHSVPLIAAQLMFAYAFDLLLSWSRRDTYTLGFGPFPVIFSINLFLWFKPDWFYLQFVMVAVGFAAKEYIRWNKNGRPAHIFNPSSFPLAIVSVVLIAAGASNITWGEDIAATQFLPPHMYLFLFLIGLPGQYLFGVTLMTMSAVITTYLFGLLYFAITGTYFFFDSYIPIAVFLGMHLLFTDPSTSPRTELGRIMFGISYGLGTVILYAVLGYFGVPAFYDKLLPVPILNVSIQLIDRIAQSRLLQGLDLSRIGRALAPRRRNLAFISVWAGVFVAMSAVDGVGDTHRGHWLPFWQQACRENRYHACANLAEMASTYCGAGSPWACNEAGILTHEHGVASKVPASVRFSIACSLGSTAGCENLGSQGLGGRWARAAPQLRDYRIMLVEGKAPPKTPDSTVEVYSRACRQGWMTGCESLAQLQLRGRDTARDPVAAARHFELACDGGQATACSTLGLMYRRGDGVAVDRPRAASLLKKACDLGVREACGSADQ